MAELGGNKWGHLSVPLFNNKKTIAGSVCFAITALIISMIIVVFIFRLQTTTSLILIIYVTIVTTFAELFSFKGYDKGSEAFREKDKASGNQFHCSMEQKAFLHSPTTYAAT